MFKYFHIYSIFFLYFASFPFHFLSQSTFRALVLTAHITRVFSPVIIFVTLILILIYFNVFARVYSASYILKKLLTFIDCFCVEFLFLPLFCISIRDSRINNFRFNHFSFSNFFRYVCVRRSKKITSVVGR